MSQVFLSYSNEDAVAMQCVLRDLQSANLDVWVAPKELRPGSDDWKREIERAIKNADCIVVLLSPDAYTSKWVNEEITCAEDYNLKIFRFIIRGHPQKVTPLGLKNSQHFDARNSYKQAIESLIAEIYQHLGIVDSRIAWNKTANFYHLINDVHAAIAAMHRSPEFNVEYVKRCLRQVQHHSEELQVKGFADRLSALRQRTESGNQWTYSHRDEIEGTLRYILDALDKLSRDNQPDFDPGLG